MEANLDRASKEKGGNCRTLSGMASLTSNNNCLTYVCSRALPKPIHATHTPVRLSGVGYDEGTLQKLDATWTAVTQVSSSDIFQG